LARRSHATATATRICSRTWRDPADIERSTFVAGIPDEDGPRLRDLGITLFTLATRAPDFNLDNVREWIAWRNGENA
jgi:hypothetical protein